MKDWKAECEILKGQLKELREQLRYEQSINEHRYSEATEIRNKFKELLIEVLGK